MAWNEPGGGKDPWGGGNKGEGPPDLDEALRKLKDRLSGMFGGAGGSGGAGPRLPVMLGALVVIIVAFSFLRGERNWLLGLYQVDEQERAVVLRLGKYNDTIGPGLHWNPPLIDQVQIVRVTQEREYLSTKGKGLMLTEDENIVELPLTVQYNIKDAKDFVLNVKNPETSLKQATDSAIRHVVGSSKLDDVVSTGREEIGAAVKLRLQQYLDDYGTGIRVVEINIQKAEPPSAVKEAYDDVIKAREDQERVVNEAQAYANGIIPEARGAAQRVLEEAMAYREKVIAEADGESQRFEQLLTEYRKAPEVTRQRLYLDAVQQVMSSSSKVLVDVEGGNNMIYLPLDKLVQSGGSSTSGLSRMRLSPGEEEALFNKFIDRLRKESSTTRRREVR